MATSTSGDGLLRWLIGGLVVGGVVLGLLVGAYEIGYHRGQSATRGAAQPATAPPVTTPTTTATTAPTTTAGGTAALGEQLFSSDGCASCHSLTGSAGVGPSVKGLAGSTVQLSDGSTVTADDAYLTRSITDPNAQIVKGYQAGIMSSAIASFDLAGKPQDVAAIVAFIKSQH